MSCLTCSTLQRQSNAFAEGNIKVSDGEVSYKGEVIHNHVVGRILDFMRQGLPYKPLTRFVEKLMENPSRRAVNELVCFSGA